MSVPAEKVEEFDEDNDLREALGSAIDKAEAEPVEVEASEPEQETRARDETGKFVAKGKVETPEKPEQPEKAQVALTPEAPVQATTEATVEAARPPSSWTVEAKSKFGSLDPTIQKEIIKREADFHKGVEEYKQGHTFARNVMDVMRPYMPMIQSERGEPVGAIASLLQTAYEIRQNPAGTIARLCQQFGVDPATLATGQPQVDPTVAPLVQRLGQLEQHLYQGQQQEHQQLQSQVDTEIDEFRSDPKNIYFENVKTHMSALLRSGAAKDLPDAYEQACYANPEVRGAILQQEQRASESKRIEETKRKAADARRASFDVQGTGVSQPMARDSTLRQTLESLMPE